MRDGEGTPAERAAAGRLGLRAPPTLAPLSIGAKVAGPGARDNKVGAVEALEYLALLSDPQADRHSFWCPWMTLFGACKRKASGECQHCAQEGSRGARQHPEGAVERVRGAASARLQELRARAGGGVGAAPGAHEGIGARGRRGYTVGSPHHR
eukprot:4207948-Pleurochrysis_carterae.AAC.1